MLRHPFAWLAGLLTGILLTSAGALWVYGPPPRGVPAGIREPLAWIARPLHALPHPWVVATPARLTAALDRASGAPHLGALATAVAWARYDERSVVAVRVPNGEGTGFSIATGVFLTAAHVLCTGSDDATYGSAWLQRFSGGGWVRAQVYAVNRGADLAVLTAGGLDLPALPIIGSADGAVALLNLHRVTDVGGPTVIPGRDTGWTFGWTGIECAGAVQLDLHGVSAPSYPGMSGSPVLTDQGTVDGVVTAGRRGSTLIVPAGTVTRWLPGAR